MKRRNRLNLDSERVVPPQPTPRHARRERGRKGPEGQCLKCGTATPHARPWCLEHASLYSEHMRAVLEQAGVTL